MIPNTSECLQYDSRYQASSIDEAMSTFSDLTMEDSPPTTVANNPVDKSCTTEECKNCREYLKKKLKEVGLLPASTITSITANSTAYCGKYNFAKKKHHEDSSEEDDDDSSSSEPKDSKDQSRDIKKKVKDIWKDVHRTRRQATADLTVIGRRFNLSCEKRGIATDGSGMLILCSRCWAWRELPDNYYPRYMNELICDDVDNSCLSGYATCGVSHRSAYVVRNDTGVVSVVTLQAGSFCECRVQTGSALEGLVTGNAGGPLPTLPPGIQLQPDIVSPGTNSNIQASNNAGSPFWY
ncbi:hypothetical protein FO519_008667 [Halicephalobus sp. NKZ332]|nr:hypothetical protein FO519_008667 [Halicephalobus sp. NKZ332]